MTASEPSNPSPGSSTGATPSATPTAPPGMGTMGMWIFLASLTVLFAACVAGYLVVRSRAEAWPPPDMPALPWGLWVSTCVILISSGTIQWALAGVRRNRYGALIGAMLITTLLGLVFLVSQAVNWAWLIAINATVETGGLYIFTFYLLTGLHALHVIGGMVFLVIVTARSWEGRYSATHHAGVQYAAMYWHFLDGVWLFMFVLLFLV
ncbi:MAG TPA: heme-copper oxidase subunit III [Phycisphaerae bacterium]|nr:heme-copper oxidase subunit III [Phycisphaerae bacterium]